MEQETLERLRRGDAGAYRDVVSNCAPRLLRLAERLGHPAQEAEDLVQDAFLALVRSVDRLEGRAAVSSWLTRVLLNRHTDVVRSRVLDRSRRPAAPDAPAPADRDEADRVRAALRRLPEAEHHVLLLRYFEGLPYDEIAHAVQAPLGTVHSHAFHGLRRLRALLEEDAT